MRQPGRCDEHSRDAVDVIDSSLALSDGLDMAWLVITMVANIVLMERSFLPLLYGVMQLQLLPLR